MLNEKYAILVPLQSGVYFICRQMTVRSGPVAALSCSMNQWALLLSNIVGLQSGP